MGQLCSSKTKICNLIYTPFYPLIPVRRCVLGRTHRNGNTWDYVQRSWNPKRSHIAHSSFHLDELCWLCLAILPKVFADCVPRLDAGENQQGPGALAGPCQSSETAWSDWDQLQKILAACCGRLRVWNPTEETKRKSQPSRSQSIDRCLEVGLFLVMLNSRGIWGHRDRNIHIIQESTWLCILFVPEDVQLPAFQSLWLAGFANDVGQQPTCLSEGSFSAAVLPDMPV